MEQKRKKITIESNGPISLYGGVYGPISNPFFETIRNIAMLVSSNVKVSEVLLSGEKVPLSLSNFDSDNNMVTTENVTNDERVDKPSIKVENPTPKEEQPNQQQNNKNNFNKKKQYQPQKPVEQEVAEEQVDEIVEQ